MDEEAVRETNPFVQWTLNALPLAACIIDRAGKVQMANDLCRHISPTQPLSWSEIIDADFLALIDQLECTDPALSRFGALLREVLAGRGNTVVSEYLCMQEGRPRWFAIHAAQLAGDAQKRILLTHQDITARRTAESHAVALETKLQQIERAQPADMQLKIHDLESFCRSVTHDLRNPLYAVKGLAEILLQSHALALSSEEREILMHIVGSATQMTEMLDGLRALTDSTEDTPVQQTVDLGSIARDVADTLAFRYRHRTVMFTVGALKPAKSYPRLLRLVMQDLIENAWKYTARVPKAVVEVGSILDRDGSVTYFVRDNGVGLSESAASKLFLPFNHLESASGLSGAGIGLATAKRIVDKLNGRIWAQGSPGNGATFYFQLE